MIAIGGLAGAIAAIATTPADVLKTRIMTAAAGEAVSAGALLVTMPPRPLDALLFPYLEQLTVQILRSCTAGETNADML